METQMLYLSSKYDKEKFFKKVLLQVDLEVFARWQNCSRKETDLLFKLRQLA